MISIATCAYVLLSWYALRGEALRPPPAPPHPLLFLNWLPLLPALFHFFHRYRFFGFIFSFLIFIYIHRDLSLCASFLVRIAGGGAAPSPLHPPTRFYFLIDFPCYLLSFVFFHMYRFFGFIFSFLIFIYIHRDLSLCASFLVRIAGGGAAPSPLPPPHPLLFLNWLPLLPALFHFFQVSFLWVHLLFLNLYLYPSRLEPVCFFLGTHCGGRRCALPPATPPPAFIFSWASLATYSIHVALRRQPPAPHRWALPMMSAIETKNIRKYWLSEKKTRRIW